MKFYQIFVSTTFIVPIFVTSLPIPQGVYSPLPRDPIFPLTTISTYPLAVKPESDSASGSGKTPGMPPTTTTTTTLLTIPPQNNNPTGGSLWGVLEQPTAAKPVAAPLIHYYHSHDPHYRIYQTPLLQEQERFAVVAVVAIFIFAIASFEACVRTTRVGKTLDGYLKISA